MKPQSQNVCTNVILLWKKVLRRIFGATIYEAIGQINSETIKKNYDTIQHFGDNLLECLNSHSFIFKILTIEYI